MLADLHARNKVGLCSSTENACRHPAQIWLLQVDQATVVHIEILAEQMAAEVRALLNKGSGIPDRHSCSQLLCYKACMALDAPQGCAHAFLCMQSQAMLQGFKPC